MVTTIQTPGASAYRGSPSHADRLADGAAVLHGGAVRGEPAAGSQGRCSGSPQSIRQAPDDPDARMTSAERKARVDAWLRRDPGFSRSALNPHADRESTQP